MYLEGPPWSGPKVVSSPGAAPQSAPGQRISAFSRQARRRRLMPNLAHSFSNFPVFRFSIPSNQVQPTLPRLLINEHHVKGRKTTRLHIAKNTRSKRNSSPCRPIPPTGTLLSKKQKHQQTDKMPENQDAPYDPYIPSGQTAPQQQGAGGNARTQALQAVSFLLPYCSFLFDGWPVMACGWDWIWSVGFIASLDHAAFRMANADAM